MDVYTMEKWQQDRSFSAEPGQEITEDVYNEMFNYIPPKTLPQGKAKQALQDYRIPVHAGFLMGASKLADDAEAISTGANYEATVYKYEYRHGERVSSKVLYDPWACFDEKGATE